MLRCSENYEKLEASDRNNVVESNSSVMAIKRMGVAAVCYDYYTEVDGSVKIELVRKMNTFLQDGRQLNLLTMSINIHTRETMI